MRNRTWVKFYRVISLLNCLGKVVEKFVDEQISQFCKSNESLYNGKIGAKKNCSAKNTAVILVYKVQDVWKNRQIVEVLPINVKRAFDHISRTKLAQKIADLGINNNLIEWAKSFLSDGWVKLVIDGFINLKLEVETVIPQR